MRKGEPFRGAAAINDEEIKASDIVHNSAFSMPPLSKERIAGGERQQRWFIYMKSYSVHGIVGRRTEDELFSVS